MKFKILIDKFKNKISSKNNDSKLIDSEDGESSEGSFSNDIIETPAIIPKIISLDELAFENKKTIGEGSFGKVYKAIYQGNVVAVKHVIETPKSTEEFVSDQIGILTELQKLNAPNIIQLYAYTSISLPYYLVMPLMINGSLGDRINDQDKSMISQSLRYTILVGVSKALAFMHHLLIIHGDVKPKNVLLDRNYNPFLTDFDGASKLDEAKGGFTAIVGTHSYDAPEILDSEKHNKSTDVFAFTILMWETLKWKVAFAQLDSEQVFFRMISGDRESIPSKWPRHIKRLIGDGWNHDPNKRPDMEVVKSTLEKQQRKVSKK